MKAIESLKARFRAYKRKHLELFREGKELARLKDTHKGQRCFIIGNGPSLSAEDLDVLKENGEITFAFNRVFHIFEKTEWRPTYYISQDEKMLAGSQTEVNAISARKKFIPIELLWYNDIKIEDATPFHVENPADEKYPVFCENIAHAVGNSKTVVFSAMQMAVYMGIKEIYLIGVDHHFHTSINEKGEVVVDPTAKDYFSDSYNTDKENLYIPNTDLSTWTFVAAREYANSHGIKIYNATRGGKLEVFPRVNFDELFNKN